MQTSFMRGSSEKTFVRGCSPVRAGQRFIFVVVVVLPRKESVRPRLAAVRKGGDSPIVIDDLAASKLVPRMSSRGDRASDVITS